LRGPLCLAAALTVIATAGRATGQAPRAPAPPEVTPVISGAYPGDRDADRISDRLETAVERLRAAGPVSAQAHDRASAQADPVKVELIFSEPVTQEQIDAFVRLGGEITYLFRAVSFGWNGRIAAEKIDLLPSAMGPTLALVESVPFVERYMDRASQTGRVRPIWRPGFAGCVDGYDGDPDTTIAFLGDGVDATHVDLADRCVHWRDFTDDREPHPADHDGHGSLTAGIALGTGQAGGADDGTLHYTFNETWPGYAHLVEPICLSSNHVNVTSTAYWSGPSAELTLVRWNRGTELENLRLIETTGQGMSPLTVSTSFYAMSTDVFSIMLSDVVTLNDLEGVTVVTSVSPYPGVGDGFNTLRGVAPGCKWAAAKVFDRDGWADADLMTEALDDLVAHRIEHNIKIINISHGLSDWLGLPDESVALRDKINSAVNNGVLVVAAAGNGAARDIEIARRMADPARAALALTVGATNDDNALAGYSTYGFFSPRTNAGEDYKPDVVAPGGSLYYSCIMSVDSESADGYGVDRQANDYTNYYGTSFAAPFVAGSAALVIDALEQHGIQWKFDSSRLPLYVKMLLCATASETNASREIDIYHPTLDRMTGGAQAFPAGKDPYEGYGLINPDAAVEAVCLSYLPGAEANGQLGDDPVDRHVWARKMSVQKHRDINMTLENPATGDFDLYVYSATPSATGTPIVIGSSTEAGDGAGESLVCSPSSDMQALVVVKRVSGSGTFSLRSVQSGPPVAKDTAVSAGINAAKTIVLEATDDGAPNPPGAMTFTIVSLPEHGQLEDPGTGEVIHNAPETLTGSSGKVVYRPDNDYVGQDSFTFRADDGGVAPYGGTSNTATVSITVLAQVTVTYQVAAGADDAYSMRWSTYQKLDAKSLELGEYVPGMRFAAVQVPVGAEIQSATLEICAYKRGLSGQIQATLYGEATDDAADFGQSGRVVSKLPKTDASQPWNWGGDAWTANTWYTSPDLSALIQEIVDRPGWEAGNGIALVYSVVSYGGQKREFWAYDGDPEKAAKLTITYRP
jgi:hypothetical protein